MRGKHVYGARTGPDRRVGVEAITRVNEELEQWARGG